MASALAGCAGDVAEEEVMGCTDMAANNYDEAATADDGTCDYDADDDGTPDNLEVDGCTDEVANNYDETATEEDNSCDYDLDDDGVNDVDETAGCTDSSASNFNQYATENDTSCTYWSLTPASGISADFVTSAWDPIIPNLNGGEMCDAILSAMTKTAARDEVIDFTRGYYTSSQGVIGAAGAAAIDSVADLNAAGTTIALQSGTTSDIYAADNLGAATIVAYEDFPSVTAAVSNGDADYALGDAPVLAMSGTLLATFSDETFGIGVREDSNDLRDALDVAITAVIDSGDYDDIFGYWFDGQVVLTDDTTSDTATAYPEATEGSTLTDVIESGALQFCSDTAYMPFEGLDSAGNAVGFDVDVGNAIVEEISAHYTGAANPDLSTTLVTGCMNPDADNYNADATADSGDCVISGCTDEAAENYNSAATLDDGSCIIDTSMKIGLLNPLTGPIAVYAPPFTWAAQAAIDDLNAMGGDFELIEADSGCSGDVAGAAAQSLVDAGVIGVAGAACSGASMAANAVLSEAGVVQISYASTNPGLSDADDYPGFWRVVPSDAIQGPAMADMVATAAFLAGATPSDMNPALIHMTNDYGSGLADSFEGAWNSAVGDLCLKIGYEDTTTDFSSQVQAISDAGCGSVVMVSYSTDGAAIVETMAVLGMSLPTFGADGIADAAWLDDFTVPAAAHGVIATKPRAGSSFGDFNERCAADEGCAGGIYTAETYDAVMMIGLAAMHDDGADMADHLWMVGDGYEGASGSHTFLENGDVGGAGYDICGFVALSSSDIYFNCQAYWTATDGVQETPFTGLTVKVGYLNPLTGPIAVYAPGFTAAAGIAIELMNVAGWSNGLQFELIMADSGCSGDTAATAAQSLIDSGVLAVAGAACSGATMAANAVLSEAGIPMVSYASTNPGLSDADAYPLFWRVVPSDAIQGPAIADVVTEDGATNPALLHMTNDYGAGLADSIEDAWGADDLCTKIGYEDTTTDFSSQVTAITDAGCDSVILVSYATDGAAIVEELSTAGFAGQIFGGDGIAEEGLCTLLSDVNLCDGIVATKPAAPEPNERSVVFAQLCGAVDDCAAGIYTAEAFDALAIIGFAIFAHLSGGGAGDLGTFIQATGQGFVGASGIHTFLDNGDVGGAGYCIGDFTVTDGVAAFTCNRHWSAIDGITTTTN